MSKLFVGFFLIFCFVNFAFCDSESVEEAFKSNEIVQDVVDVAPKSLLKVSFPSGAVVNFGNELTPEKVKDLPKFEFPGADSNSYYTLIMTDPDAPSRAEPKFREWHHLIIGNIPGSDFTGGETISEFISSAPPQNSGLHRYVFLLYQQNGKIDYSQQPKLSGTSGKNRGKFSTRDFVKKYQLGVPIAGNFYQAAWDEYVPKVYEKLKD